MNKFRYFTPAILWALLILGLSTMPGNSLPDFDWGHLLQADKLGHLVVYGIFTSTLLWGSRQWFYPDRIPQYMIITAVLMAILYGILMEWLQWQFFPGRNFDVLDIIANIIGSFIGLIILKTRFFSK